MSPHSLSIIAQWYNDIDVDALVTKIKII